MYKLSNLKYLTVSVMVLPALLINQNTSTLQQKIINDSNDATYTFDLSSIWIMPTSFHNMQQYPKIWSDFPSPNSGHLGDSGDHHDLDSQSFNFSGVFSNASYQNKIKSSLWDVAPFLNGANDPDVNNYHLKMSINYNISFDYSYGNSRNMSYQADGGSYEPNQSVPGATLTNGNLYSIPEKCFMYSSFSIVAKTNNKRPLPYQTQNDFINYWGTDTKGSKQKRNSLAIDERSKVKTTINSGHLSVPKKNINFSNIFSSENSEIKVSDSAYFSVSSVHGNYYHGDRCWQYYFYFDNIKVRPVSISYTWMHN